MKCRAMTISNRHSNVRFFLLGTQYMYLKSQPFSHSIKKMLLHFYPTISNCHSNVRLVLLGEKKIISQPFSHSVWQMFMANVALSPHPQ